MTNISRKQKRNQRAYFSENPFLSVSTWMSKSKSGHARKRTTLEEAWKQHFCNKRKQRAKEEDEGDKQEKAEKIRGNNRFSRSIILLLFLDKTVFFYCTIYISWCLAGYLGMIFIIKHD
jgi:hypothetical protein